MTRNRLPDVLDATRYVVKYREFDKVYVIVSSIGGEPVEVFANFGTEADHNTFYTHSAWSLITRLMSLCLQSGDISLADILQQVEKSSLDKRDAAGVLLSVLEKYSKGGA